MPAQDIRIDGLGAPNVVELSERRATGGSETNYYSDGGGGGDGVDTETRRYVDANMRAVRAENSSAFSRLESKIEKISPGATWQQIAFITFAWLVTGIGIVFGILAFASDRFDGGLSAGSLIDEVMHSQAERDAAQDARIEQLLRSIDARIEQLGVRQPGQD